MWNLATSELLSTFFPTWIWQGQQWIKGKVPKYDPHFWLNAHAHPVISTYYPVGILSSMLGNFFGLDTAFKIFVWSIFAHYGWCLLGWYLLLKSHFAPLVALFGAITFTFQAYHIKQQPCIVYTISWFPWIALCPVLAIGMILLAGYYPLSLYLLPLGLFLNHDLPSWVAGFLIGSIQLVVFLKYLPKTIKSKKQKLEEIGFWETNFYFGITPIILLIMNPQWRYLWIAVPMLGSYLLKNYLPRIHQRAYLLSVYAAIFMSLEYIPLKMVIPLLFLQCLDLAVHNLQLPTRPYTELYKKPSRAFDTALTRYLTTHLGKNRVSGLPWPLFTGHINGFKTLGYSGGMQLKLMAKWRNDTNPNGAGEHDYFRSNEDSERLDISRVKFAYTLKRIDWIPTPIRHLYRNPRIS